MRAALVIAVFFVAAPAKAWDKVYDGAGVARLAERGGKLWTLPGLSSSTDRGASWSAPDDASGGTYDSDISDDGQYALVIDKNYLVMGSLADEEFEADGTGAVAAWGVRFLGRSLLVLGTLRDSSDDLDGVLLSRDDGATWTSALMGKATTPAGLFVLDEKRAWVCGGGDVAAVWRTTNGGKDWDRSEHSTPLFGACDGLFFLDKKRGWSSIGSGAARTIYATDDGGAEWETRGAITLSTAGTVSLAFADKKRGWAAAPGAFWETADGGKTWTSRPAPASAVLPEAVALRYVEGRGGGRLLYGTSRSEDLPEDDEENVTGRETRSRGEIWKLEAAAP